MDNPRILTILWTNADPTTAQLMVMMYARNCMLKGWWDEVTVVIWGATARLAAENLVIQEEIKMAQHAGVAFSACVTCARRLGVIEALERLDVEVKPWGEPLSQILQSGGSLLTV